jgi:hypothetical protein
MRNGSPLDQNGERGRVIGAAPPPPPSGPPREDKAPAGRRPIRQRHIQNVPMMSSGGKTSTSKNQDLADFTLLEVP